MARTSVSRPQPLKNGCEAQDRDGRYSTTSDYVRDLIRRDQDARSRVQALQAAIDEGLASGISPRSLDEIFAEARARADQAAGDEG